MTPHNIKEATEMLTLLYLDCEQSLLCSKIRVEDQERKKLSKIVKGGSLALGAKPQVERTLGDERYSRLCPSRA